MIKFYIRTTGERELSNYYQLLYTPLYDYEHKPVQSFIKQLKIISESNSVLLEDDLLLCKDFENKIKLEIDKHPHDVINFFQLDPVKKSCYREGYEFKWNQCTYYPKGLAEKIANEMERIYKIRPYKQYDDLEAQALNSLGIKYWYCFPHLIQHIGNDSLIGNNSAYRLSKYFIDDLEKEVDKNEGFSYNTSNK